MNEFIKVLISRQYGFLLDYKSSGWIGECHSMLTYYNQLRSNVFHDIGPLKSNEIKAQTEETPCVVCTGHCRPSSHADLIHNQAIK